MIKHFFILAFLVCGLQSFSQKLIYKSNGTILNSENQKITPDQVRELLANNEQLLANYNAGRSKKTAGNVLITLGIASLATDLIIGATTDDTTVSPYKNEIESKRNYPTVLTIIGAAAIIIAIPVKIGFSKKIKNVVTDYNNQKATGNVNFEPSNLNLITNANGIGFRLTFN